MEARELRIGNLVEYAGKTCTVLCIGMPDPFTFEQPVTVWDGKSHLDCTVDDIRPIALTAETLTMLGFYEEHDSAPGLGEYAWWGNEFMALTHIQRGVYGIEGVERFACNKVHALQNAVYAIYSKELKWIQ